MDKETLEAARAVASHFIGYAARSRADLERRLARSDYPPDVIAAVIAEFAERGWIDDTQFARDWVQDRADRKRYGRGRLAAELRRRGIDRETADAALETLDAAAELERARAAAGQRWRPEHFRGLNEPVQQAEKRRCADFLRRRGFAWQIIEQVLAELVSNQE